MRPVYGCFIEEKKDLDFHYDYQLYLHSESEYDKFLDMINDKNIPMNELNKMVTRYILNENLVKQEDKKHLRFIGEIGHGQ